MLNKLLSCNNHVIRGRFHKLEKRLLEEVLLGRLGYFPQSGATFTLGFSSSSAAEPGGQIPSAWKRALQTAQQNVGVVDARVSIAASIFGTFICGFYYFKRPNYIKRKSEHRLDGLPKI